MAITHVDHVLIAVEDLNEAAEQCRKLGFHVTEGGAHPGRGTANRLVVLENAYLELNAVQDRARRHGKNWSGIWNSMVPASARSPLPATSWMRMWRN